MESITQLMQRFTWYTENQRRDSLIYPGITTEELQSLRSITIEETNRRKTLPELFVQCPRCKGYHTEKENVDNLCEKCEREVHIFNWDLAHNIKKQTP